MARGADDGCTCLVKERRIKGLKMMTKKGSVARTQPVSLAEFGRTLKIGLAKDVDEKRLDAFLLLERF